MLLKNSLPYQSSFRGGSGANLRLVISGDDKYIVKSIEKSEMRASKLAAQYDWLKSKQHLGHIVKVDKLHHQGDSARYSMEYLEDYIPLSLYLKQVSAEQVRVILNKILKFMELNIYTNQVSVVSKNLFTHYLKEKLLGNIEQSTKRSQALAEISQYGHIEINGKEYLNFEQCYQRIISNPIIISNNSQHTLSDIHGDLTLENIFINEENQHFILIDPNCHNPISSPLVDYSKLLQSTSSKYIMMQKLDINWKENRFHYSEDDLQPDVITEVANEILREKLTPDQFKNLEIYEAINFSRILPYRLTLNPDNYLIYYCRLIILLNRYLKGF